MEEALLEMKFDARKNPLGNELDSPPTENSTHTHLHSGKLSAMQIKAGYSALQEIETFIKSNRFNSAFIEANNTYYSRSGSPTGLIEWNVASFAPSSSST